MRRSYITFVAFGLLFKAFASSASSSGPTATIGTGTNSPNATATSVSSASNSSATGTSSQCSSQFSAVPSCAAKPLTLAAITLGCGQSDYACWCQYADALNTAAQSNVSTACRSETSKVASATEELCKCALGCGGQSVSSSAVPSNSSSPTSIAGGTGGNSSATAPASASSSGSAGGNTGGNSSATASGPSSAASGSVPSASSSSEMVCSVPASSSSPSSASSTSPTSASPATNAAPALATVSGVGAACSGWVANVPACGVQPITQAAQALGCGPDDYICWCEHVPDLQASWGPSIASSCGLGSPGAVSAVNDLCECTFLYAVSGAAPPGLSKRFTKQHDNEPLRVFRLGLRARQENGSDQCTATPRLISPTVSNYSPGPASSSGSSSDGTSNRAPATAFITLSFGLLASALAFFTTS